jgi:hypothetical protein
MAADITSFGTDPKAKKTVIAHLIPNRNDAQYVAKKLAAFSGL